MMSNELVDLDVDGWTELRPGTAYDVDQESVNSDDEHSSIASAPDVTAEAFRYRYLREVRAPLAPTAPKSSRESISFSELVGIDGAASTLDSERIRGICHRLELTKGITRKAKALLIKQVRTLERIMHDPNLWLADRVKAAHDLFATFGRLHWRDSQWLSKAKVDKNAYGVG